MHQINVSGCVTAVTVFWTSDFCQGDLAPVVAEELKQVGKMRVKTKTTQKRNKRNKETKKRNKQTHRQTDRQPARILKLLR